MTRFDADAPAERRKLFAEAVRAHRQRSSPYLTVEVEAPQTDEADDNGDESPVSLSGGEVTGEEFGDDDADDEPLDAPWVQFGDDVINLDCTDEELDDLKALLGEYPAFRIEELNRPDRAAGTNVRVTTRSDPKRVADFLEAVFVRVYGRPDDYRAWVVEI